MEQKDYKMEIVLWLLNKRGHIRAIAEEMGINHMMIVRKLKELQKENVVDYVQEGKNKTYFLKKNIEAKSHVFSAEAYKLKKIVEKYPQLRNVIEKIQNDRRIKIALLFGSYAKRIAKQDSDIDVYIETADKKIKQEISLIDSKLNIKIGKYNNSNLLIKEIEKNHVVIKGIENYYEKNKFFE
ncbi:nucleotidyltransferase domain-containing protein [Candidatus Pacearchaeota archaeon]|nr:nucleotidyltransferase domain-containing protein [Candidatus Pacearchaeota archaeon]